MKKINNLIKLVFFFGVIMLSSCETTNLELTENPNALSPSQANPDFFLNSIQEDFARFVEGFGRTGSQLTRIDYMSGRDYTNAYSPSGFDGLWSSAYRGMFEDIRVMNLLADEKGLNYHKGMGQVMQAYSMLTLVDFFGPVPYTEALQGVANLNPAADSGESIYAAAIALLDSAIANFESDASDPAIDFFYDGDWDNWIKAANTIKMKAYLTTSSVDGSAIASFNAIKDAGNYITSNDEDFQFRWGTNEIQPDTRHPRYAASYTSTGGGRYKSNYLMGYMRGDGYFGPNFDPRIMFYNYRQVSATPGIDGVAPDEETLECGLILPPAHYAGYDYCGVENGWWGRDHGNDNGIPPDGFLRALTGVYPAGGKLDDFTYDSQVNGGGNGGNGITPVMLASWADFMIAEVQMIGGSEEDAKTTMFLAIDKSFDKVTNFAPLSDRFVAIADGNFDGLDGWIDTFLGDLETTWDDSTDKMEVLSQQYFVALYGNGIDAYNFYRRTGYPTGLQPNIEPNPGGFIRSFFYPANYTNTNSNATQKSGVDVQVFWDNNAASPDFPIAN